jgi:type I restriction enzyme, S subunit
MSWREIQLGEAIHVKHGFAFKGKHFSDDGTYVMLTPGNFNEEGGFRLRPGKDRFYTGNIPEDYILNEGDLIIAMTEQGPGLLGSSALIPEDDKYLHNQRLGLIQDIDDSMLNKGFLYYLFNTRSVRGQISGSATGTKVRHTAPGRIYRVKVLVPSIVAEQRRIASILFTYDNLIENNRRQIHLLEQAARLLYKKWFVHLRFPGHEHVQIIDGVPEGWKKKPFSELATFLNGFAFKPAHLGDVGFPIVKIPELRDGPTAKTPRNIGEHIPEKYLLDNGDILFSWSGTLLVNIWNHGKGLLNQHLFKVTPISENLRGLVYFALKQALLEFQNQTTGATMKHIRKGALDKITSLTPTSVLLDEFEGTVTPILEQISNLQKQTTGALKARDLLLPRLMNGEIAV